jgi:PleD family two-component response regulator
LRAAIAKCRIRQFDRDEVIDAITVSIGGASYIAGESSEKFIGRADAELYRCKREGRNRVSIAETA